MIGLVFFMLGVCLALGSRDEELWRTFKDEHNKIYGSTEEMIRKEIFFVNLNRIYSHNTKAARDLYSYTLGVTRFADMTNTEFKQWLRSDSVIERRPSEPTIPPSQNTSKLPDTVDWRSTGIVPPVWDQGQCGDGGLRSSFELLGEQEAIKLKTTNTLSYQQILECCPNCSRSCSGSFPPEFTFRCLAMLGGIESDYSYPEGECKECRFNASQIVMKVTGYIKTPSGDENVLKATLANVGPVAAVIDASNFSFQLYSGGVYNEHSCSSTMLDHSVSIVGYGVDANRDYWLVRNSWGMNWGESGYIRMSRNKLNQCGIATDAVYPTVE